MTDISAQNPVENYFVAIPCAPAEFGSFIGSLLGKPQTIESKHRGSFEIGKDDVVNVFHLVMQRVTQQNDGALMQFTARIVFDDESSVLLTSLDEFVTYTEVRPLVSCQVHLSWVFIVTFQGRRHPEKQEIELSFIASAPDVSMNLLDHLREGSHLVSFRIRHTERTWGGDIESLLTGYVKSILLPEGTLRRFVRTHSSNIATITGLVYFGLSLGGCLIAAKVKADEKLAALSAYLGMNATADMKLDRLLQLGSEGFWGRYFVTMFVFIVVSGIVAIVVGALIGISSSARRPSFLLFTKKSEQAKTMELKLYEHSWRTFVVTECCSAAFPAASTWVFSRLWALT